MKIFDFTTASQHKLRDRLAMETESWEHSRIWWNEGKGKAAQEMIAWNKAFCKFRETVLANGEIEPLFQTWAGCDINASIDGMNVPQYAFSEEYKKAVQELRSFEAESGPRETPALSTP